MSFETQADINDNMICILSDSSLSFFACRCTRFSENKHSLVCILTYIL